MDRAVDIDFARLMIIAPEGDGFLLSRMKRVRIAKASVLVSGAVRSV